MAAAVEALAAVAVVVAAVVVGATVVAAAVPAVVRKSDNFPCQEDRFSVKIEAFRT